MFSENGSTFLKSYFGLKKYIYIFWRSLDIGFWLQKITIVSIESTNFSSLIWTNTNFLFFIFLKLVFE